MKPEFLTPIDLRIVSAKRWLVLSRIRYRSLVFGKPTMLIVEEGFDTDLASIPRAIHPVIPKHGKHTPGAILHDKLYRYAGLHRYSRKEVDMVFREAMLANDVLPLVAQTLYIGVRVGAWVAWNNYLRENKGTRR